MIFMQSMPDVPSRAITRVANALLSRFAASWVTSHYREKDLTILHVIGRRDRRIAEARRLLSNGQSYAIVQYVLRSSKTPHTQQWLELWKGAVAVWSYLDLGSACIGDGTCWPIDTPFYFAPLGVDHSVFTTGPEHLRDWLILTTGQGWLTESVRECALAAGIVSGQNQMVHLGKPLNRPPTICLNDLSDEALAAFYRRCRFVSGLRRTEGFELPAAEGLCCGARPILFDRLHYRQWYRDHADYIPEGSREEVIRHLANRFQGPPRPVQRAEIEWAHQQFNWESIISGFWRTLEAGLH